MLIFGFGGAGRQSHRPRIQLRTQAAHSRNLTTRGHEQSRRRTGTACACTPKRACVSALERGLPLGNASRRPPQQAGALAEAWQPQGFPRQQLLLVCVCWCVCACVWVCRSCNATRKTKVLRWASSRRSSFTAAWCTTAMEPDVSRLRPGQLLEAKDGQRRQHNNRNWKSDF